MMNKPYVNEDHKVSDENIGKIISINLQNLCKINSLIVSALDGISTNLKELGRVNTETDILKEFNTDKIIETGGIENTASEKPLPGSGGVYPVLLPKEYLSDFYAKPNETYNKVKDFVKFYFGFKYEACDIVVNSIINEYITEDNLLFNPLPGIFPERYISFFNHYENYMGDDYFIRDIGRRIENITILTLDERLRLQDKISEKLSENRN